MAAHSTVRRLLHWGGVALVAVVALALLFGAGQQIPHRPTLVVIGAAIVLLFALSLTEPALLPIAFLPLYLVSSRASLGGIDLSVSDLALFAAFWPAVLLAPRPFSPTLRTLLWLSATYQACLLFTLIHNPYRANYVEWAHEWLLISGALVVGWTIGRRGYAGLGLSILLACASVLAVITIVTGLRQYAGGDFAAVYVTSPMPMHKNFIGGIMGVCAIVAWLRPPQLKFGRFTPAVLVLLLVALAMSQSRQAIVGLAVAMAVVAVRRGVKHPRRVLTLAAIPALGFTALTVQEQLSTTSDAAQFNSANQRVTWFADTLDIWAHQPFFGVGLRWWYTDRFAARFQPPNALLEVGSSGGLIGVLGFVIWAIGSVVVTSHDRSVYGMIAFAVLIHRLVQGQLDVFWVAVAASLPFVIIGICLGARAFELDPNAESPTAKTTHQGRAPGGVRVPELQRTRLDADVRRSV